MALRHPLPPFHELTYYPTSRWIRGVRAGATLVDSRRALLVWEPGKKVPIYAFPREDVALRAADERTSSRLRSFDDPDLAGYVTLPWDAVEHWYEEEEEVFVHPRDPFVRVDALRSSRHVRVERDGRRLAESDAPVLVFETGLPTRYYLPQGDVDVSLLEDSELQTGVPTRASPRIAMSCSTGARIRICSGTTRTRFPRRPMSPHTWRRTPSAST
jgi:uncharacterized protein (DUF427 family)